MTAAFIYDAHGHDHEISLDEALKTRPGGDSLLWYDIERDDGAALDRVAKRLKLDAQSLELIGDADAPAYLHNFGTYSQLRVLTEPSIQPKGRRGKLSGRDAKQLDFLIGENWLITAQEGDVGFLKAFRDQDKAETQIGAMSSGSLAASLLDWHLNSFFEALTAIEADVDKLDEQTLGGAGGTDQLKRMLALRRQVAHLRGLLSGQRNLFYGLARPDFAIGADTSAAEHLKVLATRFDRAIDEVERGRDLVASSFDLLTSRTSQDTNELVKMLTFVTVITGVFAAVAGLMGMNFDAGLFKTGDAGFYVVTIGLFAGAILSGVFARWKGWF